MADLKESASGRVVLERFVSVKFIGFICGFCVSFFGFWLGGFDFTNRGPDIGAAYTVSITVGILVAAWSSLEWNRC